MNVGGSEKKNRQAAAVPGGADWVARVHAGRLRRGERRALSAWLAASEENARDYLRAETVWRLSGGLQNDARVQEALLGLRGRRHGTGSARMRAPKWHLGWAAGAAVVVLATAAAWFYLTHMPVGYETGLGEQRMVRLRDGSTIALNTDTRLDVRYGEHERSIVLERGEALFQVNKDPQRPFIVRAGGGYVRAVGTRFNVLMDQGEGVTVAVLEGRVEVAAQTSSRRTPVSTQGQDRSAPPDDMSSAPSETERVLLDAGQSASYERGSLQTTMTDPQRASRERIVAWREGKLRFDAWPLARALEEHNRYAVKPIRFDDPELDKVHISGVFRIGDTAALLDALSRLINVQVREDSEALILSRPQG